MRSGVVAVDSDEDPNTALLFVRGAPAKVEQLTRGGVLPVDYQQVCPHGMVMSMVTQKDGRLGSEVLAMSIATELITQKHMIICQEGREIWGTGGAVV